MPLNDPSTKIISLFTSFNVVIINFMIDFINVKDKMKLLILMSL